MGVTVYRDPLSEGFSHFVTLHDCSGCFRLERLPGGACTHWKAPPCHGAHPKRPFADSVSTAVRGKLTCLVLTVWLLQASFLWSHHAARWPMVDPNAATYDPSYCFV